MNIEVTKYSTQIFYSVNNIDDATASSTSLSDIIYTHTTFVESDNESYGIPFSISKEINEIQNKVKEIFKKWTITPKKTYFQEKIEIEKDKILSILIIWIPNNKLLIKINNNQKVEKQNPIEKTNNQESFLKKIFKNYLIKI